MGIQWCVSDPTKVMTKPEHGQLSSPLTIGSSVDVREVRVRFRLYLLKRASSPDTIENALSALSVFERFCNLHRTELVRATDDDLATFVGWLQSLGRKQGTIRNRIENLKTFFAFLVSEGLRPDNPVDNIKPPTPREAPLRPYSEDELSRFFWALRATRNYIRNRTICGLLLATGWRASEVLHVRVEDIDFDAGVIQLGAEAKGGKHLIAAPPADVMQELRGYLRSANIHSEWIFPGRKASAMDRHTLYDMVSDTARKVGLHFNVHRFRHTFGVYFLENGGDILELSTLFGHSKIETTRRYVDYATQKRALGKQRVMNLASLSLPPDQRATRTASHLLAGRERAARRSTRTSAWYPVRTARRIPCLAPRRR